MAVNAIIAAFLPSLTTVLDDLETALESIAGTPTVENVVSQGEHLVEDAIDPASLEGVSIGSTAQEAANVVAAIKAHVEAAVDAPTAVPPATTGASETAAGAQGATS
jgi:hypothetical protein